MSQAALGIVRRLPGARAGIVLLVLVAGIAAAVALRLNPADLIRRAPSLSLIGEFFAAALTPALTYQAEGVPEGTVPLLVKALEAALTTVRFGAAATSLSLVIGLPLGFAASRRFWHPRRESGAAGGRIGASVSNIAYVCARVLIGGLRSVHELLWAVVLLAALGFTPLAAVVAIGVPYGAMLAKIVSEILDEAPLAAGEALRAAGAGRLQIFCFGLLPSALPDMTAYALYRFECAIRASAVLGFFGFPTLGYYLAASFENLYYHEVWTYLYTLFGVVLVFDGLSGRIRRSLTR